MRRLDSGFLISWNKWLIYIFLALMWGITMQGLAAANQRVIPLCYILPLPTVLIVWWLSGFKQVTLDGDSLIIKVGSARTPLFTYHCMIRTLIQCMFASGMTLSRTPLPQNVGRQWRI